MALLLSKLTAGRERNQENLKSERLTDRKGQSGPRNVTVFHRGFAVVTHPLCKFQFGIAQDGEKVLTILGGLSSRKPRCGLGRRGFDRFFN